MTLKPRDPLLASARVLLILIMGVMVVVAVACAFAAPAVLVMHERVTSQLLEQGKPPEVIWAVVILLSLIVVGAVLGFLFFRHLYRIVGSVAEGDPFIPANAARLSAMGWIVVAAHGLVIPILAVVEWIRTVAERAVGNVDFSLTGILLALILFILARVFREGTRMREELEGTV